MSQNRSSFFISTFVATGLSLVLLPTGSAEPFLPSSESEVLEVLPTDFSKRRDQLTRLRQRLAKDPENPALASAIGNEFIRMGAQSGDPRFYGFARAAISKWWPETDPPESILKIRAKLQERDHDYDLALRDLEKLTDKNESDAQAWLEIANIYRVQGRYDKARQASQKLSAFAGDVPTTLSSAPLDALTGEADKAFQSLARILPEARQDYPSTVQWILTVQAEIACSLGRTGDAEQLFKEGLAANPANQYLLRGYSDFLLDQGRPEEALALLKDHLGDTGILLRAAIAARKSGDTDQAHEWSEQLDARFREIRQRGGQPHGRFEARLDLELHDDPETALTVALAHFEKQKEVRDIRNVLEAALAANNPAAAQPVLDFLEQNGNTDVTLMALRDQLNSK